MRRLADGRDALSLLAAGRLRARHIERVAGLVSRFHDASRLGVPAPFGRDVWRERIAQPVLDNLALLQDAVGRLVPRATVERGAAW